MANLRVNDSVVLKKVFRFVQKKIVVWACPTVGSISIEFSNNYFIDIVGLTTQSA